MAIATADIMEHFTQGILGAKNFDDIPKWEVENHDLTRTFFSDRLRDHANDPFNRRAIERLCSLYRSQFGIFKMKEPIAVDTSCTYANQVISYIENLTGMDLSILENTPTEEEKSLKKRTYLLEILQIVLFSVEGKKDWEMTQGTETEINKVLDRFQRNAGTSGALTESQQRNYLVEAKGKCLRCDTRVIRESDFQVIELYDFLFIEGDSHFDRKNVILLCKNCYELLKNNLTDAEKAKLQKKKHQLEVDAKYQEELDDIKLEAEIEEIIQSLTTVKRENLIPLNYEPKEVKEKIPDDFLLSDEVLRNVVNFFKYIQSLLKTISEEKKYKDVYIADDIKRLYLSISDQPGSKQEKFDCMVNWLMNKTGSSNRKACEIVLSYYIQDCEVFEKQ